MWLKFEAIARIDSYVYLVKYHRFCCHVTIGDDFWDGDEVLYDTGEFTRGGTIGVAILKIL